MADRIKKPDESGRAPQKPDLTPDKFQKPEIDRLLQIFFTQSVVGISFMTLDEPVDWRHAADPEKLLDEIFYQEQVTNFNQAYLTMFAMEAEGFLHKTPADFYAYDIKSGKEDWKALLNTGRQHINPSEQRPGSWIEGEIIALEDNSGRLLGHVTAIWEITYKKDMEAGQERMLNKISEFRYLQKKDGPASLPFVSEAFKDIFDLSQEDVIDDARAMFDRVFFADYERLKETIEYSRTHLSIWEFEFRINHPGKGLRWIKGIARPEKLPEDSVLWQGYFSDITESKKTEEWIGFLNTVLMNISDSVIISDVFGEIIYANRRAKDLHGYEPEDLLGKSPTMLNINPFSEQQYQEVAKALAERRTYTAEGPSRRKDGSTFTCEYTMTPIYDDNGTMTALIGIQRDVTEHKKMVEALRKSNERFEMLTKQSRVIAWEIDTEGLITYCSDGALEVLGYSPEEIVGHMRFIDFVRPDLKQEYARKTSQVLRKNENFTNFYYPAMTKTGGTVHMTVNGMRSFDEQGSVIGYRGLNIDITEKTEMEQMIENEKERYRTTLLSVGDGVISTDHQGNITVMNPVAEKLTGWTQEDAIGKPLNEVFVIIDERSGKTCENPADLVLKSAGSVKSVEPTLLISVSGTETPIVNSAAPIISNLGQITGVVIVFRDFSEYVLRQKQNEYLSFHDPLTGLYNRRFMEDAIKETDNKNNLPLTVMILDVNGLKLTNDAFGHKAGDALLKTVADILRNACRRSDVLARMGGDEFFILLPHTDEQKAEKIKQRIIKTAMKTKLDSIVVSLACGYSVKSTVSENIDHIITAADNLMYKEKLKFGKTMRNETIETVLRNLNFKYDREQIHTERVSQYCEAIAAALQLNEKDISDIKIAGSLHDIGKIMVPPELLSKPGKLTAEEFDLVKRHPETGYQILKSVDEYVTLAKYLLYHHERWDGSGYPEGLQGKAIPLQSRIIAVADAYEAMTANRPYQTTRTGEEAKAELRKCAGTQFDPEIVDVFIREVLG